MLHSDLMMDGYDSGKGWLTGREDSDENDDDMTGWRWRRRWWWWCNHTKTQCDYTVVAILSTEW